MRRLVRGPEGRRQLGALGRGYEDGVELILDK
jgi:hypothetical protein